LSQLAATLQPVAFAAIAEYIYMPLIFAKIGLFDVFLSIFSLLLLSAYLYFLHSFSRLFIFSSIDFHFHYLLGLADFQLSLAFSSSGHWLASIFHFSSSPFLRFNTIYQLRLRLPRLFISLLPPPIFAKIWYARPMSAVRRVRRRAAMR